MHGPAAASFSALQVMDVARAVAQSEEALEDLAEELSSNSEGPRVISSEPTWRAERAAHDGDGEEGVCSTSGRIMGVYYSPLRSGAPESQIGLLAEARRGLLSNSWCSSTLLRRFPHNSLSELYLTLNPEP